MTLRRPGVVVHHPADHPYVANIGGGAPPQACVWDVDTLRALGTGAVHLHFGFEHLSVDEVQRWTEALAGAGIALVHTVHDLENPHLRDQREFAAVAGVVVGAAARLLTLSPWAADEVARRHGRRAQVVPHPHVVGLDEIRRRRAAPVERRGVYVHAGTARPNLDVELVESVADVAHEVGGMLLHVRASAAGSACGRRLAALGERPGVRVETTDRLTDAALWDRLQRAAVVVLPYRWGTHSGLLEAAHDLGTPVVAPAVGAYADQGAGRLRPGRLVRDLHAGAATIVAVDEASRRRDLCRIAAAHERCYGEAMR